MAKRTKVQTAECGVLQGIGATKAEAKADLARKMEAALSGPYDPVIIASRDGTPRAIVWRTPFGFSSRLWGRSSTCGHASDDLDTVCRSVRAHVAQTLFDVDGLKTAADAATLANAIADDIALYDQDRYLATDARMTRAEFVEWCVWQFGWARAKASGITSGDELRERADRARLTWRLESSKTGYDLTRHVV